MPFYKNTVNDAIKKVAHDAIPNDFAEGRVVSISPAGVPSVSFYGTSQLVEVEKSDSVSVKTGQRVILWRSKTFNRWVIINAYGVSSLSGSSANGSSPGGGGITPPAELAPPQGLHCAASVGQVTLLWSPPGARSDVIYEIEVSEGSPGTGATIYVEAGGSFSHDATHGTTVYFRGRSLAQDWSRSAWSDYVSGVALGLTGVASSGHITLSVPSGNSQLKIGIVPNASVLTFLKLRPSVSPGAGVLSSVGTLSSPSAIVSNSEIDLDNTEVSLVPCIYLASGDTDFYLSTTGALTASSVLIAFDIN